MAADGPFHFIRGDFWYAGNLYDASEINYISIGMRAAHTGTPRWLMHFLINYHNKRHNEHPATPEEHFFGDWGYDFYKRNYSDK